MINVIKTQKLKLPGEILYDILNPNLKEVREYRHSKPARPYIAKKREKCLKFSFIITFLVKFVYSASLSTI